jgi:hypothetical protein
MTGYFVERVTHRLFFGAYGCLFTGFFSVGVCRVLSCCCCCCCRISWTATPHAAWGVREEGCSMGVGWDGLVVTADAAPAIRVLQLRTEFWTAGVLRSHGQDELAIMQAWSLLAGAVC